MSGRVFNRTMVLAAAFVLTMAVPVLAQTSPTTDAYGGQQGEVLGNFTPGGTNDVVPPPTAGDTGPTAPRETNATPVERGADAPVTPSVAAGSLPFTGFEAALVALAGLALLGSGFAMRRATRAAA